MNLDPDGFFGRAYASLPGLLLGKRAVHGHFHPRKYQPLEVGFRTAIIREPVARMISHYFYWKTLPPQPHQLYKYFVEQDLTIEEFARLPFIRYFYTRVFFGGMNLSDFDFIGTLESLPHALAVIGKNIGHPLEFATENKGDHPQYQHRLSELLGDSKLQRRLADLFADDIRFYEEVRDLWA